MKKYSLIVIFAILFLAGLACSSETETGTEFTIEDIELAENVLLDFFAYLAAGEYKQAAALHAGPDEFYEMVKAWNMTDEDDAAFLLEEACTYQLVCMEVYTVVDSALVSDVEYEFIVQFQNSDGSLFELGPCCGEDEDAFEPTTDFMYSVIKDEGDYKVLGGPVYVP